MAFSFLSPTLSAHVSNTTADQRIQNITPTATARSHVGIRDVFKVDEVSHRRSRKHFGRRALLTGCATSNQLSDRIADRRAQVDAHRVAHRIPDPDTMS